MNTTSRNRPIWRILTLLVVGTLLAWAGCASTPPPPDTEIGFCGLSSDDAAIVVDQVGLYEWVVYTLDGEFKATTPDELRELTSGPGSPIPLCHFVFSARGMPHRIWIYPVGRKVEPDESNPQSEFHHHYSQWIPQRAYGARR